MAERQAGRQAELGVVSDNMGDIVVLEVKRNTKFGDGRRRTGYLVKDNSHGDEAAWIDQGTARERCWACCVQSNFEQPMLCVQLRQSMGQDQENNFQLGGA